VWQRCDPYDHVCDKVLGKGYRYVPAKSDEGWLIELTVIARNAHGEQEARSAQKLIQGLA
jgi:hypothetical protein